MSSNEGFGQSVFVSRACDSPEAYNEISARKYNLVLGLCLLWGFVANAAICYFAGPSIVKFIAANPSAYLWIIIGYAVLAIVGIVISSKSDSPGVSFLGYNMIVLPLGVMLSVVLAAYSQTVVFYAFTGTAIITGLMIVMAEIFPTFFLSIGRGLIFALLITLIVEIIARFLFHLPLGIIDMVVVLIFCGYIGFDWARAQRIPYSVGNAIDAACSLYLDIINIFLRLLAIFGRSER